MDALKEKQRSWFDQSTLRIKDLSMDPRLVFSYKK